jgi:hypothetical protein
MIGAALLGLALVLASQATAVALAFPPAPRAQLQPA